MSPLVRLLSLSILISLSACSTIIGVEDVELGGAEQPDAGTGGSGDAPGRPCNVASNFGLVSSNPTTASISRRSDGGSTLTFLLNADTKPDSFSVMLYKNMGGHGLLETPGSYSLTAADSKLETCGICAFVNTDFDRNARTFAENFMALSQGTLSISAADATHLAGSMTNLKFRRVDISSGATREVSDPCTVTIDRVIFDLTYPTTLTAPTGDALPPARLP